MGTRNLTCVVKDGEFKVAQYGQWDGYPSGSGRLILAWLQEANIADLSEAVDNVCAFEGNEAGDAWVEVGGTGYIPTADFDNYPSLSRNMGSDVLDYVVSELKPILVMDEAFADDSLFCEWAYVIDLDTNTFEVYEGFNKEPLTEADRFFTGETPDTCFDGSSGYHPVKLAASYNLSSLPTQVDFLAKLEPEDEE